MHSQRRTFVVAYNDNGSVLNYGVDTVGRCYHERTDENEVIVDNFKSEFLSSVAR